MKTTEKMNIQYVNWTLGAYSFNTDTIFLHKDLERNPQLMEYVLRHELKHKEGKDSLFKEAFRDIFNTLNFNMWLTVTPFYFTHPYCFFMDSLPIKLVKYNNERTFVFNHVNTGICIAIIIMLFFI